MFIRFFYLFALFLAVDLFAGSVAIVVTHIRNNHGLIRLALYRSSTGFPHKFEQSAHHLSVPAKNDTIVFNLDHVENGDFAVAVIHDENENDRLDTNFLGMPLEGYGSSNNTRRRFGPPLYEDARVSMESDSIQLEIKMNY